MRMNGQIAKWVACAAIGFASACGVETIDSNVDTEKQDQSNMDSDTSTGADSAVPSDMVDTDCPWSSTWILPGQDGHVFLGSGAVVTDAYLPLQFDIRGPIFDPAGYPPERGIEMVVDYCIAQGDECQQHPVRCAEVTVPQGGLATVTCDVGQPVDGDGIYLNVDMIETDPRCLGIGHAMQWSWNGGHLVYRSDGPAISLERCVVLSASVGAPLDVRCDALAPRDMKSLEGKWTAEGTLSGIVMDDNHLRFENPDARLDETGMQQFSIAATDGITGSEPMSVSFSVDRHASFLQLYFNVLSADGSSNLGMALLPEEIADAVATACGDAFNPADKPESAVDPALTVDIDSDCARRVLGELPEDQARLLSFYPWAGRENFDSYVNTVREGLEMTSPAIYLRQIRYESTLPQ
jgi:hypothetical protein